MQNHTAILIPAAGSSMRLSRPKQLLEYHGKSLLNHAIDEALAAQPDLVMVITGAHRPEVESSITGKPVKIMYNKQWEEGIGTGIAAGVGAIINHLPVTENIIIVACDQPFVSAKLFEELSATQEKSGKGIVASSYAGTRGTPALFTQKYFASLTQLAGDTGAKTLIRQNADDVADVDFPKGNIDVDTEEAFRQLPR
jgi:molybdenum cofactor cytidylyltransferase